MSATQNFIQARWFTHANRAAVDVIVIHTMELPCQPGMARRLGERFRDLGPDRKVSAHFGVDPAEVYQYVREGDVAWHCPKANRRGLGVEHAGYGVGPNATDWGSPAGHAVLTRSAALVARLCQAWAVPVVHLTPTEVAHGGRGLVGHVDVTRGFPGSGTHVDPGPNWPWAEYLALVVAELPGPSNR